MIIIIIISYYYFSYETVLILTHESSSSSPQILLSIPLGQVSKQLHGAYLLAGVKPPKIINTHK